VLVNCRLIDLVVWRGIKPTWSQTGELEDTEALEGR
jgi:hypothetical protein